MKLATLKDGSRDGQLAVVSRDLTQAHFAAGIATRLQQVLDDWNYLSPQLEDLYTTLNHGRARHAFAFDPRACMAPLPRAAGWAEVLAYPDAAERVWRARGAEPPPRWRDAPPVAFAPGDGRGAHDDAVFADASGGRDFGPQVAVVTGDVAAGAPPDRAADGVRLLVLANAWRTAASGGDPTAVPPPVAFAPVAVTPEELGDAWRGGRARLELEVRIDGARFVRLDTAAAQRLHAGQLIARIAAARPLRAGFVVGSGTVGGDGSPGTAGCIAERRALAGDAEPFPFLDFGRVVRVEAFGADGGSVFGAIEQRVSARDE